jgi:hypothetical protein
MRSHGVFAPGAKPRPEVASLCLEVFNVFNFQAVTRVNELSTSFDGLTPLPEYKKPLQHQTPRQVRLGLRYTF